MAPNPNVVLREKPARGRSAREAADARNIVGPILALIITSIVGWLAVTVPWARRWVYSGSAIESILIIYGAATHDHFSRYMPLWTTLAFLNLVYAVAATSPQLYVYFVALCYTSTLVTSLLVFPAVTKYLSKGLKRLLKLLRIGRDRIVFSDLPALKIDAGVSGLFVLRCLAFSLSDLTIEAHGIELGLKLAEDIELAFYTDQIVIHLFRRISIEEIYAVLKPGSQESNYEDGKEHKSNEQSMLDSHDSDPRPTSSGSGMSRTDIEDVSIRGAANATIVVSAGNSKAENQYNDTRKNILATSPIRRSREQAESDHGGRWNSSKEMRATICAKLQEVPSVPHAPARSIKITTILDLLPEWLRRFLSRTPLLLRLILMLLSYSHAVYVTSLSTAGAGRQLAALWERVFGEYRQPDSEFNQLEQRVSYWLGDANFCLELTNVDGFGQVPLRMAHDIVTYIRCADIVAYRNIPDSTALESAMQLGGADATFAIPLYLLPHHDHLLPAKASEQEIQDQKTAVEESAGPPQRSQAERELAKLQNDETQIAYSVHGRLPVYMEQSLLDLFAEVCKEAGRVIKMEKSEDREDSQQGTESEAEAPAQHGHHEDSKRKRFAGRAKDFNQKIKEHVPQLVKQGVKKATLAGMVDDQWIAKIVGMLASQLERTQGDLGYLGEIPVALPPYRRAADLHSKLLA